ncbi:hypothetical protein Lsai_2585 [Legionella sainthelensi]|uniref:Uncharacterized protein n=1 Tax=Legionella sainthelensi TaxID=28087 RepID=A0A0W0YDG9_9GAMM|nr:hypothetical protein [Legionella sainthelensi]KTD54993.1 hypothetical protein Lsai_2585 [Legionella sainthelensi]VEH36454.1 Uncharacterised protein [Legionella sainthelensi]
MSDLFEEDEDSVVEVDEDFDLDNDLDIDAEVIETVPHGLDARRRLENMLDEKRLRDELDDFGDY